MDGEICPNMELNLPLQLRIREIKFIRNFKTIKTTDVKNTSLVLRTLELYFQN